MKCSPQCALDSKQASCKYLPRSPEAVGNTQTMSLSASKQGIFAENAGRENAPSFYLQCCWNSDLQFQTCNWRIRNVVSLECKEIHMFLTIKHRYHQLSTNTCTIGVCHTKFLDKAVK